MAIPPTTLADLATETVTLYGAAVGVAQADLAQAQADLAAARLKQAADTANLAATQKEIAALRAQLAITEVPADADALLADIAELQVVEREGAALLLDDADALAVAQARADAATAWLGGLNRRAAEAAAAGAAALADKERRDRWKAAAAAPPLDTLAADAGALQDGTDFSDAEAQVADALPPKMRDVVDGGWALENERLKQAAQSEEEVWTEVQKQVTAASPVALARVLAVADEKLRRWAEQGAQRYAHAQAQVLAVPTLPDSLLTEAENDAVEANVTDGPAAAGLLKDRLLATVAVVDARATLDDAVLKVRAPDPTLVNFAPLVAAQQAVLDGKIDTEGDAILAYGEDEREAYGLWSGDVPEAAWKKVVGLKEADATLTELRAVVAADLVQDDEDAEAALADALWKAEKKALTLGFLESQAALRGALLEQIRAARPARLLAALRGDA